jgi:hypothetical protein
MKKGFTYIEIPSVIVLLVVCIYLYKHTPDMKTAVRESHAEPSPTPGEHNFFQTCTAIADFMADKELKYEAKCIEEHVKKNKIIASARKKLTKSELELLPYYVDDPARFCHSPATDIIHQQTVNDCSAYLQARF